MFSLHEGDSGWLLAVELRVCRRVWNIDMLENIEEKYEKEFDDDKIRNQLRRLKPFSEVLLHLSAVKIPLCRFF